MTKEELFEVFSRMFPEFAKKATSYKKIGSRVLAIKFVEEIVDRKIIETSRVFLYIDENNWQFGTKLWRKRPERLNKKLEETTGQPYIIGADMSGGILDNDSERIL